MSNPADCPFCYLGDRVIKENKQAILFLSNPRKTPGHLLAAPKRHVEKPWELTTDELQAIFDLLFEAGQKLLGKLGEGFDIRENYRPFLPQGRLKIDHVHFHLTPRSNQDHMYEVAEKYDTDLFEALSDDERQSVTKLLAD